MSHADADTRGRPLPSSGPAPWALASPRSRPRRATPCASSTPITGAAEEAVARIIAQPAAPGGEGPDQLARSSRRPSSASPRVEPVGRAAPVRARDRGGAARTSTPSARSSPSSAPAQAADTVLATNTSSLDITAIADGLSEPGAGHRPALLQPAARHAPRRGRPRARESARRGARGRGRPDARLGQDARCAAPRRPASSSTAWRARSTARPSGCSMDGRRRRGHPRLPRCASRPASAMGPLELTDFIGQDVNLAVGTSRLGADGPRRALRPDRAPAAARRGRPPRPQDAARASTA